MGHVQGHWHIGVGSTDETMSTRNTALPSGPPVPDVPGLGTTWYHRGAWYWARRSVLITLLAFVVAVATLLGGGVFAWILSIHTLWLRLLIFSLALVALMLSLVRGLTAFNAVRVAQKQGIHLPLSAAYRSRSPFSKTVPTRGGRAIAGTGAAVGVGAAAGNDALGGLLALAVVFIYGDLLGALLVACLKYAPREFPAVLAVAKWKVEHPEWIDDRTLSGWQRTGNGL